MHTIEFPALELMERLSTIALAHGMTLDETLAMHDRLAESAGVPCGDRLSEVVDRVSHKTKGLRFRGGPVEPGCWGQENGPEMVVARPQITAQIKAVQAKCGMEVYQVLAKMNGRLLMLFEISDRSEAENTKTQLLRLNETSEVIPYPSTKTPHLMRPLFIKGQTVFVSNGDDWWIGPVAEIGANAGEFFYKVSSKCPGDGPDRDQWFPETAIEVCNANRI